MPSRGEELSPVARDQAERVGQSWALQLRADMQQANRRACGGWPGTLSQARVHVALSVLPWLASQGQEAVTSEQREGAARVVYASARSVWMQNRDAEEGP